MQLFISGHALAWHVSMGIRRHTQHAVIKLIVWSSVVLPIQKKRWYWPAGTPNTLAAVIHEYLGLLLVMSIPRCPRLTQTQ